MWFYKSLFVDAFSFLQMCTDNFEGSIDQPVEDGDTALHLACLYGHLPCVQVSYNNLFDNESISLFLLY